MEVREPSAGYLFVNEPQLTEIGPLPADWSVSTVGDEFHVQLGKMLDTEKNVGTPKLFLGNRAVQWGRIDVSDVGEIRMSPSELQRYRLVDGDLLVCEGGEVGRSAIWRDQLEECYYQKALHRLRAKRGYSHEFMAAVLEQFARGGKLQNYVTQTSIAHLPKEKFVALPIPKPAAADEQHRISRAVGDADGLIESLEQLLTKKRQIKQGAMQELLTGKRRLPGFEQAWTICKLGDIATITMGRTPARLVGSYWGSGHKWLSIADLKGKVIVESKEEITDAGAEGMEPIPEGTLLMSFKLTIGRLAFAGCELYTNEAICALRSPQVDSELLYYALSRVDFSLFGKQAVKGYTLNKESLHNVEVLLPSEPEEQRAIAQVLASVDNEIIALESRLTKARALKQAMAQALLTGRIRLVEPTK